MSPSVTKFKDEDDSDIRKNNTEAEIKNRIGSATSRYLSQLPPREVILETEESNQETFSS